MGSLYLQKLIDFAETTLFRFVLDNSHLCVLHWFLIMDTLPGIIPYLVFSFMSMFNSDFWNLWAKTSLLSLFK